MLELSAKINESKRRKPIAVSTASRRARRSSQRYRRAGPPRKDRADRPHGSARRSLRRRHRAVADGSVVRQRRRNGEARHRGGRERQDRFRSEELGENLLRMDAQHSAVVHLAPALVGSSDSGVVRTGRSVLRCARPDEEAKVRRTGARLKGVLQETMMLERSEATALDSRGQTNTISATKTCSTRGSHRRCGRSRRLAGRIRRRNSTAIIRRACSSPASTSSSSGSPA